MRSVHPHVRPERVGKHSCSHSPFAMPHLLVVSPVNQNAPSYQKAVVDYHSSLNYPETDDQRMKCMHARLHIHE